MITTNRFQVPSRSPGRTLSSLRSSRHSSLSPNGQAQIGYAADSLPRTSHTFLETSTFRVLLGLVGSDGSILWWYLRIYLLRPDTLLFAPQDSTRILARAEEVSSSTPLYGL